jgi:hypothetical protein
MSASRVPLVDSTRTEAEDYERQDLLTTSRVLRLQAFRDGSATLPSECCGRVTSRVKGTPAPLAGGWSLNTLANGRSAGLMFGVFFAVRALRRASISVPGG